jgi:hypothetical protein
VAPAQTCSTAGATIEAIPAAQSYDFNNITGMHLGETADGVPPLYIATQQSMVRADISQNPAQPVMEIDNIGSSNGGPIPTYCDYYTFVTNVGAWEDGSGNGRVVSNWRFTTVCGGTGHAQALEVSGGAMTFGQQLDPRGDGNDLGYGRPIQVLQTSAGRVIAYFGSVDDGVYAVDVTNLSGNPHSSPIRGALAIGWDRTPSLAVGAGTAAPYLFGVTATGGTGTLHVAAVDPAGILTEVASISYAGSGAIDGAYRSVDQTYWVLAVQNSGTVCYGIGVFQFDPADNSLTPRGQIPPPAGDSYGDVKLRGGDYPVVFALRQTAGSPTSYEVIAGGLGISVDASASPRGAWDVQVPSSGGSSLAYLYEPLGPSGGEYRVKATTADVTCARAIFADVPPWNPFFHFVNSVANDGISAGCGSGFFCPQASVLRAQMSVFLERAKRGSSFVPPPAVGIFQDVPTSDPFAPWIEQAYNDGITGGCAPALFCPGDPVTRASMAVFLLAAKYGAGYAPPPCAGIFSDVACPGAFTNFIEELYNEGITGGCGSNPLIYCPASPVTRGQMAVFLVTTFSLP